MDRRLLIFLHVPKAAGSTLKRILRQQYGPEAIYDLNGKTAAVLEAELAEVTRPPTAVTVLAGHTRFGIHERVCQDCDYLTVLREPTARLLSHYRYVKRLSSHPLHAAVNDGSMSLADFARKYANTHTRFLAGGPPREPDAEMLELAQRNLRAIKAVGIAERFDESVILFNRIFGWRLRVFSDSNVSPRGDRQEEIGAEDMAAVRETNRLDDELYRAAQERFARDLAEHRHGFGRQLWALRAMRKVAGLLNREAIARA